MTSDSGTSTARINSSDSGASLASPPILNCSPGSYISLSGADERGRQSASPFVARNLNALDSIGHERGDRREEESAFRGDSSRAHDRLPERIEHRHPAFLRPDDGYRVGDFLSE